VAPGEPDDFEIISNDSIIRQFQRADAGGAGGGGVISSIALVAAGIGIMNIMLVSVTERTREIGIRRAIGAKKRHVMTQFVVEAVALCQIGGIAGVLLGSLAGIPADGDLRFPAVIPWDWVAIGMFVCSLVGSDLRHLPGLEGRQPRSDRVVAVRVSPTRSILEQRLDLAAKLGQFLGFEGTLGLFDY
jgi:putative ABC transport system permease protein